MKSQVLFYRDAFSPEGDPEFTYPDNQILLIGVFASECDAIDAIKEDCANVFGSADILGDHPILGEYAVWHHREDEPPCGYYYIVETGLGEISRNLVAHKTSFHGGQFGDG